MLEHKPNNLVRNVYVAKSGTLGSSVEDIQRLRDEVTGSGSGFPELVIALDDIIERADLRHEIVDRRREEGAFLIGIVEDQPVLGASESFVYEGLMLGKGVERHPSGRYSVLQVGYWINREIVSEHEQPKIIEKLATAALRVDSPHKSLGLPIRRGVRITPFNPGRSYEKFGYVLGLERNIKQITEMEGSNKTKRGLIIAVYAMYEIDPPIDLLNVVFGKPK